MRIWVASAFALAIAIAPATARTADRQLKGQVLLIGNDDEPTPAEGVFVTLVQTGDTAKTKPSGLFELPLKDLREGQAIKLSAQKEGWKIHYPLDGEWLVPAPQAANVLVIKMLPAGSPKFWTQDRFEKFVREHAERAGRDALDQARQPDSLLSGVRPSKAERRRRDYGQDIKDWANGLGFSVEEAKTAIDKWVQEVEQRHRHDITQMGLAAYWKANFAEAHDLLVKAGERGAKRLESLDRDRDLLAQQVANDFRSAGNMAADGGDYQRAVRAYERARSHVFRDRSPLLWAVLTSAMGSARGHLGVLEAPQQAVQAIAELSEALKLLTPDNARDDWADATRRLAAVSSERGAQLHGADGERLVREGIEIYLRLLKVLDRKNDRVRWWKTQSNLGMAWAQLAGGLRGKERDQALNNGRRSLMSAIEGVDPMKEASELDSVRSNLAKVLSDKAETVEGPSRAALLREAVETLRVPLRGRPVSYFLTMRQITLSNVLASLAEMVTASEAGPLVSEALAVLKDAEKSATPKHHPQLWAAIGLNRGSVLLARADLSPPGERAAIVEAALAAVERALTVFRPEYLPRFWAMAQTNRASTLQRLALLASGKKRERLLTESLAAFRSVLDATTPERDFRLWAFARLNHAVSLLTLARSSSPKDQSPLLAEGAAFTRTLIEKTSKDDDPNLWARANEVLGDTLMAQSQGIPSAEGMELLQSALDCYRRALEVWTLAESAERWAGTHERVGYALVNRSHRSIGESVLTSLEEAVESYRNTLTAYTRESSPDEWARSKQTLAIALLDLGREDRSSAGVLALEEAVASLRDLLEVGPKEQSEEQAQIQFSLGGALADLADRSDTQLRVTARRDALRAYDQALAVYSRTRNSGRWMDVQEQRAKNLLFLSGDLTGNEREQAVRGAADVYRAILGALRSASSLETVRMMSGNLARTLLTLAEMKGGEARRQVLAEALKFAGRAVEGIPADVATPNRGRALTTTGLVLELQAEGVTGGQAERLLRQAGEYLERSLRDFNVKENPGECVTSYAGLARIGERLGNWKAAEAHYEAILAQYPRDAETARRLFRVRHEKLFDFPGAYEQALRWLVDNPSDLPAQMELALASFTTARFGEARANLVRLSATLGQQGDIELGLPVLEVVLLVALGDERGLHERSNQIRKSLAPARTPPTGKVTLEGLRHFVAATNEGRLSARREILLALLDALAAGDGPRIESSLVAIAVRAEALKKKPD